MPTNLAHRRAVWRSVGVGMGVVARLEIGALGGLF
jgi:hypothetical protein